MSELYLSNVRLSFPKLVEATVAKGTTNAAKKFGADFLMAQNHPDFVKFMTEVGKIATEKWKEQASPILSMLQKDKRLRCYGNGDDKTDKKTMKPYVGYDGNVYISASSAEDKPPIMVAPDGTPVDNTNTIQRQAIARKMYGGCFVNAVVRPWVQDNSFGRGIRCELVAVQFCNDGDAFGEGATDVSGMFKPIEAVPVPSFFQ